MASYTYHEIAEMYLIYGVTEKKLCKCIVSDGKRVPSQLREESTDLLSEAGESTSRRDPPNNPSGGKLVATLVRYGSVKVMNRPAFLEMRPFWLLKGRKRPFEK
ncbi:hypothetical protein CEXT_438071 [Caerostris extrusa]|uniref:Uncharacterized protein n=1 Tax=Caerostris extrusa TaxID=172846 RepID=A0AAV4RT92_CAEEX|nr:hypothetical protein CEXT_438071 [Caerostris extrusa]